MVESVLFIGGYVIQTIGNGLLLSQVLKKKSVYGLAVETQLAYLLSTISRCIWSLDTRLVETKIAYFELFISLLISTILLWSCFRYQYTNVVGKNARKMEPKVVSMMLIGSALLAILIHPGSKFWSVQILVAFSIYLEAVALLPQLAFMRRMVEIEPLTSLSVSLLVISRITRLGFWISLFYQGENFFGLFLADVIHCIFTADYLINWIKKFRPSQALLLTH